MLTSQIRNEIRTELSCVQLTSEYRCKRRAVMSNSHQIGFAFAGSMKKTSKGLLGKVYLIKFTKFKRSIAKQKYAYQNKVISKKFKPRYQSHYGTIYSHNTCPPFMSNVSGFYKFYYTEHKSSVWHRQTYP